MAAFRDLVRPFCRVATLLISATVASAQQVEAQKSSPSVAVIDKAALADEVKNEVMLRAFLTYGNWSEGLRGFVGGVPFRYRTDGLTYGA